MIFRWIRGRRRKQLAQRDLPPTWLGFLTANVAFFSSLQGAEREKFLEQVKVFAWEKQFIGAQGFTVTDEVRVTIAAAAVRLTLGLDLSFYDRLAEVVVYPSDYKWPEAEGPILGEHHDWGTVVLSWDAVLQGLRGEDPDGINTAVHEFAHAIDRADGEYDGTPPLHAKSHYQPWTEVMTRHYERLLKGRKAELAVLDDYAGESPAEFFAVATEAFFDRPELLREKLPDMYRELKQFYRVDPAKEHKV